MNKIPSLLTSISGEYINNKEDWEAFRRNEILALFQEYVYGVRDIEKPKDLYFKVKEEKIVNGMYCKEIIGGFGTFSFPFSLYLPQNRKAPVPVFVYVVHEFQENNTIFDEQGNISCGKSRIPIKDITERGVGIALMPTRNIYRDWDSNANYKSGIFSAVQPINGRQKNSWASISAWAWGASRVMDYLETEKEVDCSNIAVAGHSRGGKTALWAAATDSRFKLAVSNNSGCMGAAVLRGKKGEHVKDINRTDWFCENFKDFNEYESFLPVDQHMLLASIAPRYVYVASSSLDEWADPTAEFLSCHLASEAYQLYEGVQGFVAPQDQPEINTPYHEGHIAYHVKTGEHSITDYDWQNILDYFEKIRKDC